jgi:predicted PurR-regulated permease PerM
MTASNKPQAQASYNRRALITVSAVVFLLLLFIYLPHVVYVALLAFAGILLAIMLRSIADWVSKYTRLSHGWSLLVVVLVLVGIFVGLTWLAAPRLIGQMNELSQRIPESFQKLRADLDQYPWVKWLLDNAGLSSEDGAKNKLVQRATGALSATLSGLVTCFVILVVGIYMAANPKLYMDGVLRLVPMSRRPRAAEILGGLGYTLRWWLTGQLAAMLVVGILTTAGLTLLGVPLALVLGMLAMFLDFIPNFGPIIAAAPAILLTLVEDPHRAIYVAVMYFVIQQIEGSLITPLIHQRTVNIPPAMTILFQMLLGVLIGVIGLLLATPLLAALLVLVKMLYVEDTLGDEIDTPDDHMKPKDQPTLPKAT